MQKKTIIILITAIITIGIITLGIYLFTKKSTTDTGNGVDTPWYQNFNPFGIGSNKDGQNDSDINNGDQIDNTENQISRFYQITDFAVAGAGFLNDTRPIEIKDGEVITPTDTKLAIPEIIKNTEEAPSVRFIEKKNGHLYKMFLDKKVNEKVSNSTIPSIYESLINNTGNTIIYRYLSDNNITSFIGTLGSSAGSFLQQNIFDISLSKDKTKYFYLTKNTEGASGVVGTFDGTKKDTVFKHPFTEWLSQWDKKGNIYLTTKPSYSVSGSMFILDPVRQTISKIFGGVSGLTTLISPDGQNVLYGASTSGGPLLGVFNIKDHSTKNLDTYGLPEKCIWSNDNINIYCGVPNTIEGNQYPDIWYQGLVSFNDFFVKINTTTGEKETLANSQDETPVDATYLFLDNTENNLFFTNKKDSTLWMIGLN